MAQRRRKELQMKRRQRIITALCIAGGAGAMLLSLAVCLLIFDPFKDSGEEAAPAAAVLPYDESMPFSVSDLTAAQLNQLRTSGRLSVSDGPRGISIGDTLDEVLEKYPTTFSDMEDSDATMDSQSDEALNLYYAQNPATSTNKQHSGSLTGMQSDEEVILYCASYFENQNGIMTALPPRGLMNIDGGEIVVTLLAPTSAYPAGTKDSYGSYEHVYCIYTIEPVSMTVSDIVLGIDR